MPEGILHFLRGLASRSMTPAGARQSVFLFIHLALLIIVAVVAIVIYVTITAVEFTPMSIIGLAALAIFGALGAAMGFQAAEFAEQHGRDLDALRVFKRVAKGRAAGRYAILIRPMSRNDLLASNALPAAPFGQILSAGPVYAGPKKPLAMEAQLMRVVEKIIGPLTTMGAPAYESGAGRAPVSVRDWRTFAGELSDQASVIFYTPGIDDDARHDLEELLKSDFIRRTIIVEPGALDEPHTNDVEADSVIRWNSLKSVFADHGYALPAKSEHGALIYFGVAGAEPRVLSFGTWHTRNLRLFVDFVARSAARARRDQSAPAEKKKAA